MRAMVDHYETLQLSPSADGETVERVYRLLAKRYHPDNPQSGDAHRFAAVRHAYEVLTDPDTRAAYDATYEDERHREWRDFRSVQVEDGREEDRRLFRAVLSALYVARRRQPDGGGMAPFHLERLLATPTEHLEFPLWYLKQRGYVEVLPTGLLAITVEGIDEFWNGDLAPAADRLLAEGTRQVDPDSDGDPSMDAPQPDIEVRDAADVELSRKASDAA
ncbi:MAG: J domain-containing protein [Gemmatimonadetes bacterium]|nr:J domain-containing protein [Gemmatimonadota bacterium]